ncbi:MAG: DUF7282 domain-containing protein [Myxococcota bacterium]
MTRLHRTTLSMLLAGLAALSLAACDDDGGGEERTWQVTVSDQDVDPAEEVAIDRVVALEKGWVAIHEDDAGAPGPVIGQTGVERGETTDVVVTLDRPAVNGETLHAMLHVDHGQEETWEFPGQDVPVEDASGNFIMASFTITGGGETPTVPTVVVGDQTADPADEIVVSQVVSDGPGWVVIHADDGGEPGDILGQLAVSDGVSEDLTLVFDEDFTDGQVLHAMLHADGGTVGDFEPEGPDTPVVDQNGETVSATFTVTVEGAVTPSVTVDDQTADPADQVVVAEVVSDGPGWMVIHEDDGGAPGDVVGFEAVDDGTNTDVTVTLDRDAVDGETLYAMLHIDAGTVGTYEFPGDDGPVLVDGSPIAPPFVVTVDDGVTPSVTVDDQTADPADQVVVAEVVSDGPGWMVIHEDDGGAPGDVVGFEAVDDGTNTDVTVTLDRDAVDGETLYAMLHIDAGTVGTYEFPGDDGPVLVDGSPIAPPFVVTVDDGVTPSVTATDQTLEGVSTIVTVDAATSDGPGWMVIHEDDGGAPGDVIGHAALTDGTNEAVEVVLDRPAADGETLYAMLHTDAGTIGTYEFPGDDGPVTDGGSPIAPPFVVTVPAGLPAIVADWSTTGNNWFLVEVTPAAYQEELGPLGSENTDPDITLIEGWRYEMVTDTDVAVHPWALRDSDGGGSADLLTQNGDVGAFEEDPDVAWDQAEEGGFTFMRFTLTADLAAATDSYWCSVHTTQMEGGVTTAQP